MKKSGKTSAGRRKFLKGAALGGVATLVAGKESVRAQQTLVARAPSVPAVPPPEADPPERDQCFDRRPFGFGLYGGCNQVARL